MRILVVSDTHGSVDRVCEVYKKLTSEKPVDMIIHCGDYFSDGEDLRRRLGARVFAVKGNCDGFFEDGGGIVIETEAGDIYVTHGHMENVGFSMERLMFKAMEKDCCLACFGHTHRAVFTEFDGIYFMNPGSLTRPRDGSSGTFGVIDTDGGYITGRIVSYAEFTGGGTPPKKKVTGGHLRDMLNYSDGF